MTEIQEIKAEVKSLNGTVHNWYIEQTKFNAETTAWLRQKEKECGEHRRITFGNGKGRVDDRIQVLEDAREKTSKVMLGVITGTIMAVVGAISSWIKHILGGS